MIYKNALYEQVSETFQVSETDAKCLLNLKNAFQSYFLILFMNNFNR
jgi:hypothetical protein